MRTILSLTASVTLLCTTPLAAQLTAAPAQPAPAAATTAPQDADPALWVLRDEDTTIYLFGTMHIARPNLTWFDEAVADAFAASSELQVEVDMPADPSAIGVAMVQAASNTDSTLTSRMTEAQRTEYLQLMQRVGAPYQQLEGFDAWFVGLQFTLAISQRAGLDPSAGADQILLRAARERNLTITAFETADQQVGMFDSLPEGEQIDGLLNLLRDMPAAMGVFDRMATAWAQGSDTDLAAIIGEGRTTAPAQHRIIFTDRNRRWAESLAQRMAQPGTVFVAVGAGHLVGDDSVQTFLAQRGLTVQRVAY